MSKQVIEYGGEPVGITIPENGKLKFLAVKLHVMDLDKMIFPDASAVGQAIDRLVVARAKSAS